jgi:cardiolipin synthase
VYWGFFSTNYFAIFILFVYAGFSDWLDGYLARKLNQYSQLGERLDPLADRLYILVSLGIVTLEQIIPLWVLFIIVLREVVVGIGFATLKVKGFSIPPVHYIGKAGTLMLMYALPLVVLSKVDFLLQDLSLYIGFAFLAWAIVTYWYAGYLYLRQSLVAVKGT